MARRSHRERPSRLTGEYIRFIAWEWPFITQKEEYLRTAFDAEIKSTRRSRRSSSPRAITSAIGIAFALARGDIRRDLGWYATVPMLALAMILVETGFLAFYVGLRAYELQGELGNALTMYNAYLRIAMLS